jgi:hypothetical protein
MAALVSSRVRPFLVVAIALFLLAFFAVSGRAPAPPVKHGLTGSYYLSTLETHSDVNPTGQDFFVQVWFDPNDFQLPKPFGPPAASRVDEQVAFGKGKGFADSAAVGRRAEWAPAGYVIPKGFVAPSGKPWDHLAAVIWKGYIHLPKAGTYYFATVSHGPSAVYLNDARVALNGIFGGVLVSDAFSYTKEDVQDFVHFPSAGREEVAFTARPGDSYVVPVNIDRPRDLPIEVKYQSWVQEGVGIDLFWVTPDSPRDAKGHPVAQIVPADALFVEPTGTVDKPAVRSANSMISADFLYFPVEHADKDVTVSVRLADKDGNPVAGKRVHVSSLASYGSGDTITQPEKPTDANGVTTAKLRAGEGHKVTHDSAIFATDVTDLVDVAQVAHVTFQSVPISLFPDNFSPYYGQALTIEPEAMMVGRPVTVSTTLENRSKFSADVTVTFKATDWNIGTMDWRAIGEVRHVQLKPGEVRKVNINWTPKEAQTHQCFKVELTGQYVTMNQSAKPVLAAALLPVASPLYASTPEGSSIWGVIQQNLGAVGPPPPCPPGLEPAVSGGQTVDPIMNASTPFGLINRRCTPSQEWKDWGGRMHNAYQTAYQNDCAARDRIHDEAMAHNLWLIGGLEVWEYVLLSGCPQLLSKRDSGGILWHDPPDAAYQRFAIARSATPVGYLDAWTKSWERYQGARSAGDKEWMAKHLTAIQLYIKRLGEALRREADAFQQEADKMTANAQAEQQRLREWLQRNASPTPDQLKKLQAAGISEDQVKIAISELKTDKDNLQPTINRKLWLDTAVLDRQAADELQRLAASPTAPELAGRPGLPLVQTYDVGNPHDKQETVDLFIRPISIPPDWKLSIVNAEQVEPSGKAAKPGDDPPQFPVNEVEPGKHYAVTLPAKGQVKVASVLVPVGEVGAHTTARWAVEGKIGDELVGGMVHEMNVPYIIADLKLPPVGSNEAEEELPAPSRAWMRIISEVASGILVLGVLVYFFIFWRRRRARAAA